MTKYLYGAAVQGIQSFIFQTNKLQEIVGASELVESICTEIFAKVCYGNEHKDLKTDPKAILNAAGNIKYIFDNKESCERVVRIFPKIVMESAPGITISQSVVKYEDGKFRESVQTLEKRLRTQRNKQMRELNIGLMGIERSRHTGLPVTHIGKEHMDSGTYHKLYDKDRNVRKNSTQRLCDKAFGHTYKADQLAFDINNITGDNDWIAIIHADGNGLGQVVQKIGTDEEKFKEFSKLLDEATIQAAISAFNSDVALKNDNVIPMRPIVLGGDDHTVICRADLAIPYIKAFMKFFENKTGEYLGRILDGIFTDNKKYLTACAGIAFVKSSFPFHYGYRLASSLCDRAKKDTKELYGATTGNLPASCLMFHKVQDSFVSDFKDIVERELTPQSDISFEFGPYYLDSSLKDGRWSIDTLLYTVSMLNGKEGNAVKSHLRKWMSLLHEDPGLAEQKLRRLKSVINNNMKNLVNTLTNKINRNGKTVYPVYDILSLNTINNQKTR